jgi:hypothetical protein
VAPSVAPSRRQPDALILVIISRPVSGNLAALGPVPGPDSAYRVRTHSYRLIAQVCTIFGEGTWIEVPYYAGSMPWNSCFGISATTS